MYGSSTGRAPIHVNRITVFVIVQNNTWLIGCNYVPRNFDVFVGIMNKIAIDMTRAITPPSLFGTDRRIAYANRKYRSGWICTGVTRGCAGVKLSGSLKMFGSFRVNAVSIMMVTANPKITFTVK
jgi:hypothetical protein